MYTRTYASMQQLYNGLHDCRNVFVLQYINGLPIFSASLNYSFIDNIFQFYSGTLTGGTSLNNTTTVTLPQLRKLFLDDIERFDHRGAQYTDTCFTAEFGYFNLNAGSGNTTENIVKAWHLIPKSGHYPEAYYEDNEGKRIYYFNGTVSSH